jgi:hypothetical protein
MHVRLLVKFPLYLCHFNQWRCGLTKSVIKSVISKSVKVLWQFWCYCVRADGRTERIHRREKTPEKIKTFFKRKK